MLIKIDLLQVKYKKKSAIQQFSKNILLTVSVKRNSTLKF